MSAEKKQKSISLIIILFALLFAGAAVYVILYGFAAGKGVETVSANKAGYFSEKDLDDSWSTEDASHITLMGDSAEVSGSGAYYSEGSVYIMQSGKYVINGSLDNGSIIVEADKSSEIRIMLDSVRLNRDDDAALRIAQAGNVYITLAEGSKNSLISGKEYSEEAQNDNVTGAVFSRDDLTINGSGQLDVISGYRHGIVAKDDLKITGGIISVSAPEDGIRANDSIRIIYADITSEAGDDGVVLNHADGYFYMGSGSLNITGGGDGIHSGGDVTVAGGNISISAGDDGIHSDTAFCITDGTVAISECYEGIEAVTIEIAGGDTLICSKNDGLNANGGNGDMFGGMQGGNPGGRGGHGMMTGSGNSVSGDMPGFPPDMGMPETSGGHPGMPPDRNDSSISDNTFREKQTGVSGNGFGGRPFGVSGNMGGRPQMPSEAGDEISSGEKTETYVKISGGSLTIINESGQDADGIDSNGDILITGGTVRVSLVNNGNNCALDYASESGGKAEINGGTVIACGNYSMAEQFDSTSSQASILYIYSEGAEAGTRVALEDRNGNVLLEYEVPQTFSALNISCPGLKVGETYLIVIGDKAEEITIEETSASYGDAVSGGFGGRMNFGGMQHRGDFGGFGGQGMDRRGFASANGTDKTEAELPEDTSAEPEGDIWKYVLMLLGSVTAGAVIILISRRRR